MEKEEPPIVIDAHVDETKVEDLGILLETPAMEHEGSVVETPVVVNDKDGIFKEKTTRRLTGSLLKVPADDNSAGENVLVPTTSGGSLVGSDEMKGGANVDDGSSSLTPSKKKELKMSKKIALNKLPTNVRDLLGMGLLEGLLVKYVVYVGKSNMVLKVWSRAMVYCVHALYARDVELFQHTTLRFMLEAQRNILQIIFSWRVERAFVTF